jgi:hypothetical protein
MEEEIPRHAVQPFVVLRWRERQDSVDDRPDPVDDRPGAGAIARNAIPEPTVLRASRALPRYRDDRHPCAVLSIICEPTRCRYLRRERQAVGGGAKILTTRANDGLQGIHRGMRGGRAPSKPGRRCRSHAGQAWGLRNQNRSVLDSPSTRPPSLEGAWPPANEEDRTCGFYGCPTSGDSEREPLAFCHLGCHSGTTARRRHEAGDVTPSVGSAA